MKYFLDSNTLIEAKNRYYGMRICPAYWQWLLLQNQAFSLASIEPVKDELTKGHDELAAWAIDNSSFFWGVSDEDTQTAFVKVVTLVAQAQGMKTGAMEEFLRGADPWLIAKALTSGATVVTHEVRNMDARRKFIIPNLCEQLNVPYMNTFELLHHLSAIFVLPQPGRVPPPSSETLSASSTSDSPSS
ncbi:MULTISPECIES: DUF4411 family protein [Pseudomonas syringae group]|uniref:DUF4411 family protein n=1 Tax=Pseudomonas coronafaciens pv. striafaciens TaxID=235276 RepID=A0A3M4XTY9_9PSED|nr:MULTISPECIES: DUF4411 family protein [Pseudomonas syringae group]MBS7413050.1 DUF4411 family protein [Pseudomonas syringae]PBQ04061.1 hypothetical protein CCL23_23370 [Pseudomonas syringae]RMR78962.1 hypothetical protein ALP78_100387 [Pseudomonas coronafaciens pv. striafaciens]